MGWVPPLLIKEMFMCSNWRGDRVGRVFSIECLNIGFICFFMYRTFITWAPNGAIIFRIFITYT